MIFDGEECGQASNWENYFLVTILTDQLVEIDSS